MAANNGGDAFEQLLGVIAALREYCPWTRELSHESLLRYLVEEAHEVIEVVETGDVATQLQGELGDILLQVVLHARIAEEAGFFRSQDVVQGLTAKLIRRNPHVFYPDGSLKSSFPASIPEIEATWNQVKSAENPARDTFEGIPDSLPALMLAQKTLERAEQGGADQEQINQEQEDEREELSEAEFGEQLLSMLEAVPHLDAERALRLAVRRFQTSHKPE